MKLLIFAPCEKVIIDKAGNPTLVSVLQNLAVQLPAGEVIPPNAVAPKEWFVFTHWLLGREELGRNFVQKVDVLLPNQEILGGKGSSLPFRADEPSKNIAQNTVTIAGFPVGQVGPVTVRLWVEENGVPITEVFVYPLQVTHSATEQRGSPVTA